MIYLVFFGKEEEVNDVTGNPKHEVYSSFQGWSFERTQRPQMPLLNENRYENFKNKINPISLDDFNKKTFFDNDIVIVPFLNRQRLNIEYRRITKQILKYLNPINLHRENTYIILGVSAESNGNLRRGDKDYTVEEAADVIFKNIGKENQKIKLVSDGSVTWGIKKPSNNKSRLVSGSMFLEWAEDLIINHGAQDIFNENIKRIKNFEDRDKLFTCLQRRPRMCRFVNLYNIKRFDLLDDGFVSLRMGNISPAMGFSHAFKHDVEWKIESEEFMKTTKSFSKFLKDCKSRGMNHYTADDKDLHTNQALQLSKQHYIDSYFHVAVETLVQPDIIFFTEKIYKPIMCGQPFFVLGNRGMIKKLQEWGIKTFDEWWDESYDEETSHWERSKKVFTILSDLKKKPKKELNQILNDMLPTLTHNYYRLHELINEDKYLEEIINTIIE